MRRFSGFTLIEMMIVMGIISIFSLTLLPRISSYKERALRATAAKEMSDISYALSLYFYDKGNYPASSTCSAGIKTDCSLSSIRSNLSQYLSSIPRTSYSLAANRSFGSAYLVPIANQYGYVGLGNYYIFTYHTTDARDNQQYRVINMPDNKTWLAENLNYATNDSSCYNNNPTQCANDYGRLYTWDDAQTACTPGRHLASSNEWTALISNAGIPPGTNLKAPSAGGVDTFGLSILLAGKSNGNSFHDRDTDGVYRTTETANGSQGVTVNFSASSTTISFGQDPKSRGHSIRCIKD